MKRSLGLWLNISCIVLTTLVISAWASVASPTDTHPRLGTVSPTESVQVGDLWQITLSRVTVYLPGYSTLPGVSDPLGGLDVAPGEHAAVLEGEALRLSSQGSEDTLTSGFRLQTPTGQPYPANNAIKVQDVAPDKYWLLLAYLVPPSMHHFQLAWLDLQSGAEEVWTLDL